MIGQNKSPLVWTHQVDSLLMLTDSLLDEEEWEATNKVLNKTTALTITHFGKKSVVYGRVCLQKAALYEEQYLYQKAENWYESALEIYTTVLGKQHPDYAYCVMEVADFYDLMTQNKKAEHLYLEALSILEKAPTEYLKIRVEVMINLATLYTNMGIYDLPLDIYQKALTLWQQEYGKNNDRYTNILDYIGDLYLELNEPNYKTANLLFLESKTIREKLYGKLHPNYAISLYNLAVVYIDTKNYPKAERLLVECMAIQEKTIGIKSYEYAMVIWDLGDLYRRWGRYDKAEKYLLEALSIQEKTMGILSTEQLLGDIGDVYFKRNKTAKSAIYHQRANDIRKKLLTNAAYYLSEKELLAYLELLTPTQDKQLTYAHLEPVYHKIAYNNTLFYRGFLLNSIKEINQLAQKDTIATQLLAELKNCQSQLAIQYTLPTEEQQQLKSLEKKVNTLQKKLSRQVDELAAAFRLVDWKMIQKSLKFDEVAIEFVHYEYHHSTTLDSMVYAALILTKFSKQPLFVPLFDEETAQLLLNTQQPIDKEYIRHNYAFHALQKQDRKLLSLYELIWQPLQKYLAGAKTVYYVPSGLLHRLNLKAIQTPTHQPLADLYHFVRLHSTRQLTLKAAKQEKATRQAILMGGIQYDLADSLLVSLDSVRQNEPWNYLKWTELEIEAIAFLLEETTVKATLKKEQAANEVYFKSIGIQQPAPEILHIATHGYFFPDTLSPLTRTIPTASVFKNSSHPMIRSGLLLAGSNYAWKYGQPYQEGLEDGILTAYEISQMNLTNTELVVLSACQTGLGDIRGSEGVYGLQRAFQLAGVRYLMMSLWQVPDFQTQELMTAFYYYWLEEEKAVPLAFEMAQAEIRQKYANPFYWAGFVLVE